MSMFLYMVIFSFSKHFLLTQNKQPKQTKNLTNFSFQQISSYEEICKVSVVVILTIWDLTLWEPAYDIFVLRFWPKNSSFQLPYQRPSSYTNCARELFKGSNGSASLVDCTKKQISWLGGCRFFVTDVISKVVSGSFWLMLPGLGPNR